MTERQTRILESATKLFAQQGYAATSTAKIAAAAQVSEGLIFRHFKNKQGLLDAIAQEADARLSNQLEKIQALENPAERIQQVIQQAFKAKKKDHRYQTLRSQLGSLDLGFGESQDKLVEELLTKAFTELQYEDAATEAQFLRCALDGIRLAQGEGKLANAKKLRSFVEGMYA